MTNIADNRLVHWQGYRIERVNESHYPAIVALLNTTFKTRFRVDTLQKKYDTAFLGAPNIAYIAFADNLAVSYHMGLLTPLIHQGHSYLSLQGSDAATHPHYGQQGIWTFLSRHIIEQMKAENIAGTFAFPNQYSYPICIHKLKYEATEAYRHYDIPVHSIPVGRIAHWLKLGNMTLQWAMQRFKPFQISPIGFSSFDQKKHLIVHRSPDYLNYKTKMGSFFIQLHNTVFWLKIKNGCLFIGDLQTPNEGCFDQAMAELHAICFRAGLKSIVFQTHMGSFVETLFAQRYPFIEILAPIYRSLNPSLPFALLKCTCADTDTF